MHPPVPHGRLAQGAPETGQPPALPCSSVAVASLLQAEEQVLGCHHGYLHIPARQSPPPAATAARSSPAQAAQGLQQGGCIGANLHKNLLPVAGWRWQLRQELERVWPNSHSKHGAGGGCSR